MSQIRQKEKIETMVDIVNIAAGEDNNVVSTTYEGVNKWAIQTPEQRVARAEEVLAIARAYAYFTGRTDQYRHEEASNYGGFWLLDGEQTSILRSAVAELVGVSL